MGYENANAASLDNIGYAQLGKAAYYDGTPEIRAEGRLDSITNRLRSITEHLGAMQARLRDHADTVLGAEPEQERTQESGGGTLLSSSKLSELTTAVSILEDYASRLQAQVSRNCTLD